MSRHTYFVMCARGLEPLLHEEIRALKLGKVERQTGGVRFEGTRTDGMRANLWLRTAGRVLLRLSRFAAGSSEALYEGASRIAWEDWMSPDGTLRVDAQVTDSAVDHSRFAEQRIKDAICDRFREKTGRRPSVSGEDADLRVHLHLYKDRAVISLDSSGSPLRKRGWRTAQGTAPLAETLSAGLVLASGWNGKAPLIDPFCGSGTILVEAGLIATNSAPGLERSFGFERWPDHDAAAWKKLQDEARKAKTPVGKLRLVGHDMASDRLRETAENLESAGLGEAAELSKADARTFQPKAGWNAWIISNLPYGRRIGRQDNLEGLHREFGNCLKTNCVGFHATLLTSAGQFANSLGLHGAKKTALANGGLECERLVISL